MTGAVSLCRLIREPIQERTGIPYMLVDGRFTATVSSPQLLGRALV